MWLLCGGPLWRGSCVGECGVVRCNEGRVDMRNVMDGVFRWIE